MKAASTGAAKAAASFLLLTGLLTGLAACSSSNLLGNNPEPQTPADIGAPSTAPPPVDLAGRWQLSAAAGGACTMNFGGAPGTGAQSPTPQGTIAPAGGCPANFFMSRKWTFENGKLVIHDFKGRQLVQMSYLGGHFEGHDANGSALTLSKLQ